MPDSDFDTIDNLANEYPRIKYRTEFTYIHKHLGGILSQFGINYAPFIHHMNEIFLDKHDATEIKIANGIKIRNDDPLANYMTLDTLREYTNAIANVVNHAGPRTSISQFRDHMVDSIRNARRRVIAKTGNAPESNISRTQIQKVNNIIQRNHELFMAGYSKIYIK